MEETIKEKQELEGKIINLLSEFALKHGSINFRCNINTEDTYLCDSSSYEELREIVIKEIRTDFEFKVK